MSANTVIYDWVSFTSKIHSAENIISLLGLHDLTFQHIKGAHGYQDRLYYDGVSIHYNGREDMGVWCELSGQGCRVFETYGHCDYRYLFDEILDNLNQMNLTRLDVAFDDHDGILDIDRICKDTISRDYISKSDFWEVVQSSKGQSIYHGSPKSDIRIRIYDKAAERVCSPDEHWIRVELQLRDARALSFSKIRQDIGPSFAGVVANYLRYVDPDDCDSNRWRWPLKDYWADLLQGASRIQLYEKVGVEYNMMRCENYVVNQCGNAIDAMIQCYGVDGLVDKVSKRKVNPNPKYRIAVDEYKRGREDGKKDISLDIHNDTLPCGDGIG